MKHKALAQPERHELQAKGEHPAPCARHCEANAFQIVIKNLKAQLAQPEQEPKCGAIIEVFGKDWRLEFMSLPVGKHKLYTQQYIYTTPPQRKPLTDEEIERACVPLGAAMLSFTEVARAIERAHGIKENT